MPFSDSLAARRRSSVHLELPPSTIRSPSSMSWARLSTVCCVGSPAGTMIHTARGAWRLDTRSSSDDAPVAPWPSASDTASSLKSKATTWWSESRWTRWTILPPIRPRPTKPSCIWSELLDLVGELLDRLGGVALEPDSLGRPVVAAQRLQVPGRLGVLERAERVAGARYLDVLLAVVDELQEDPGRRAPLVELSGRVQEARPVAERRGASSPGAYRLAKPAHRLVEARRGLHVPHDRHVVGRRGPVQQPGQRGVVGVGDLGQRAVGGVLLEHLGSVVLGLLDVRLVEWVDAQDIARHRGRELGEEEDSPQVGGAVHRH